MVERCNTQACPGKKGGFKGAILFVQFVSTFSQSLTILVSFQLKAATSRFVHFEKFGLNVSSWSFAIRVDLLHPWPSMFLFELFYPLWCLSSIANYYFKDPCSPKRLCALFLLFWNGSFIECRVLNGCHFPSDNFQLLKIPAMNSG